MVHLESVTRRCCCVGNLTRRGSRHSGRRSAHHRVDAERGTGDRTARPRGLRCPAALLALLWPLMMMGTAVPRATGAAAEHLGVKLTQENGTFVVLVQYRECPVDHYLRRIAAGEFFLEDGRDAVEESDRLCTKCARCPDGIKVLRPCTQYSDIVCGRHCRLPGFRFDKGTSSCQHEKVLSGGFNHNELSQWLADRRPSAEPPVPTASDTASESASSRSPRPSRNNSPHPAIHHPESATSSSIEQRSTTGSRKRSPSTRETKYEHGQLPAVSPTLQGEIAAFAPIGASVPAPLAAVRDESAWTCQELLLISSSTLLVLVLAMLLCSLLLRSQAGRLRRPRGYMGTVPVIMEAGLMGDLSTPATLRVVTLVSKQPPSTRGCPIANGRPIEKQRGSPLAPNIDTDDERSDDYYEDDFDDGFSDEDDEFCSAGGGGPGGEARLEVADHVIAGLCDVTVHVTEAGSSVGVLRAVVVVHEPGGGVCNDRRRSGAAHGEASSGEGGFRTRGDRDADAGGGGASRGREAAARPELETTGRVAPVTAESSPAVLRSARTVHFGECVVLSIVNSEPDPCRSDLLDSLSPHHHSCRVQTESGLPSERSNGTNSCTDVAVDYCEEEANQVFITGPRISTADETDSFEEKGKLPRAQILEQTEAGYRTSVEAPHVKPRHQRDLDGNRHGGLSTSTYYSCGCLAGPDEGTSCRAAYDSTEEALLDTSDASSSATDTDDSGIPSLCTETPDEDEAGSDTSIEGGLSDRRSAHVSGRDMDRGQKLRLERTSDFDEPGEGVLRRRRRGTNAAHKAMGRDASNVPEPVPVASEESWHCRSRQLDIIKLPFSFLLAELKSVCLQLGTAVRGNCADSIVRAWNTAGGRLVRPCGFMQQSSDQPLRNPPRCRQQLMESARFQALYPLPMLVSFGAPSVHLLSVHRHWRRFAERCIERGEWPTLVFILTSSDADQSASGTPHPILDLMI